MPARSTTASPAVLLTAAELAAHLGVSKVSIYRGVRAGEIPAHRLGKVLRFALAEVLAATSAPAVRLVPQPRREGMSQQARDFFYGRGSGRAAASKKTGRVGSSGRSQ